ncbi:MAG: undecaprenyl phosphate translocase family protein [Coprobacillaceae bacterium]
MNFLKGIIVGIGGIAPGLSGSALLVIFGLYEETISAIGTLFKDIKKNLIYLIPIIGGFGVGIILFSNIINYFLTNYEVYTRFKFLGLVVGTVPLFYRETKKNGWSNTYYLPIAISFVLGLLLFFFNGDLFPRVASLNVLQSIVLGVVVAGSTIVPGVDSATILSALGLYEIYLISINSFNISVLLPAGLGLVVGALVISFFMNRLLETKYTLTFSIIFGLFLSIIPSVVNDSCTLGFNMESVICLLLMAIGFGVSLGLGKIKKQ